MVTRVLAGGNYLSRRHSASFAETRRYLDRNAAQLSFHCSPQLTLLTRLSRSADRNYPEHPVTLLRLLFSGSQSLITERNLEIQILQSGCNPF